MKRSQPPPPATHLLLKISDRIFWLRLIVLLCGFGCAATGYAQQSFELSVSHDISFAKNGFDFRQIKISTSNGAPAARDLTVWCQVYANDSLGKSVRVVQPIPITLKAGDVSFKKDLYLPPWVWASEILFTRTASTSRNSNQKLLSFSQTSEMQHDDVLVIEDAKSNAPSTDKTDVLFNRKSVLKQSPNLAPNISFEVYSPNKSTVVTVSTRYRQLESLPKRWVGYTTLEQVIVNSEELIQLAKDSERFEALVHWVAMGGSLVVCDCGDDLENVISVMRALSGSGSAKISKTKFYCPTEKLKTQIASFMKRYPNIGLPPNEGLVFAAGQSQQSFFSANWQEVSVEPGDTGGVKFGTNSDVLLHRYVQGQVFLYRATYDDFTKAEKMRIHFLSSNPSDYRLINSLGTINSLGDPYVNWQLIGVGLAPLGLFMFVVVAFMTVIGPAGFSYLKSKQRLHYQIWLVPLVSAAACLTLLGYAFLSEGVGTKLRQTVFVQLDQNRQMAATYGRYSVYSALQPRPYELRDDQFATLEYAGDGTPSFYRWSNDGSYKISGGYASARNVHQVFRAMPVKTNSRINVSQSKDSDSIELTNGFKDEVKMLVCKADGKIYFTHNLAASESQIVFPTLPNDLSKTLGKSEFFKNLLPTNSEEYRFESRNRRYYSAQVTSVTSEPDVGINQITAFSTIQGIKRNLEDGHYIAVLDSMSEVPSVVPGAREIDGRVFVRGKW